MIPDISYLILNFNPDGEKNAAEILEATIDTFYQRKSKHITSEVFLLDQGSPEFHRNWIREKQSHYGFKTILLDRNIGISGAINHIAAICKSPVFGLITSDVIITSGMDEDLFDKLQIPDIYQVTPMTDKSDVDYQKWQPKEPFGSDHVDLLPLKEEKTPILKRWSKHEQEKYLRCIAVEFNVIFWRTSVFDKIGYFDERWLACYENNDFSLRCFLAGGCSALSLESFVWHYHKVTEKNNSRIQSFCQYGDDWSKKMKKMWDDKWPKLNNFIDIYKPLKNKTIFDYPILLKQFAHNIHLPYEQKKEYY